MRVLSESQPSACQAAPYVALCNKSYHLLPACTVCAKKYLFSALCMYEFIQSSTESFDVDIVIESILQMRKPRPRKVG